MATETHKPIDPARLRSLNWLSGAVTVCDGQLLFRHGGMVYAVARVDETMDLRRWLEEPSDGQEPEV